MQRPEDVAEARKLIAGRAGVLVKLEKPAAMKRLDEIVDLADAAMVARGDLGVEMPPEDVPPVQKEIIHACRLAGKPVVVATQMLESMVNAPVPTRAEASDVATAIYEGADAVMLSAETAAGPYPLEAVAMMDRIVRRVQADPNYCAGPAARRCWPRRSTPAPTRSAPPRARSPIQSAPPPSSPTPIRARPRCARRASGRTCRFIALTARIDTARRLAMVWGLHCVHTSDVHSFSDMVQQATRIARREGFAEKGERIVITAGVPFGTPGATNVLHIAWVHD